MMKKLHSRIFGKAAMPAAFAVLTVSMISSVAGAYPVPISSIEKAGDFLPLERVQPKYPRSAFEAGVSGHVVLELTVQKDGQVWAESIKVLQAEPKGVFDKVAKDAAMQFRYQPMMIDGKATSVSGVRYKFSFNTEK